MKSLTNKTVACIDKTDNDLGNSGSSIVLGAKLVKRDLRDNGKQEFEQEKHEKLTWYMKGEPVKP